MKVDISREDVRGTVEYFEKDKTYVVSIDDSLISEAVQTHLNTEREFFIPETPGLDDYRTDVAMPTDNSMYFSLALCTLHAETGVWVHWNSKR